MDLGSSIFVQKFSEKVQKARSNKKVEETFLKHRNDISTILESKSFFEKKMSAKNSLFWPKYQCDNIHLKTRFLPIIDH